MSGGSRDDRFDALKSALDRARALANELRDNELLTRLIEVFERMPEGDRETIIGALEKEVETRVVSQDVADTLTHVALRPNPNARLYLRVIEQENAGDDVEMLAFMRALYSVQRNIDSLDPSWRTMIVLGLQQMDPAARAHIDGFNRAMRILLDEAASADGAEPEVAPSRDADAQTPVAPGTVARPRK